MDYFSSPFFISFMDYKCWGFRFNISYIVYDLGVWVAQKIQVIGSF